ncbi:LysR family transcriptional regulator [Roseateles violae]|uniref:LysR family transcriptional regulator n=1 Tax=Roseateles violae TaxID=3058042 RepID=A0ABT8DXG0_9BURK|nr:LysR family transcriptional regulator [Pelomonas sp. PFR6]MDN3922110.1 LysR family transcriptional regulator [Pelomonas sp. PFR6]
METSYLDTFVLVVESGSMSEAARRLELTPAAVAHQLKLLEQELGTRLLVRAGRTVVPTEAGHRLVDKATTILLDLRNIKAAINDEAATGELKLGAINTALHSLMPEVLAGFVKVYPEARVDIRSALSVDLYDAVSRGELDAAICLHPPFALPKTMCWEQLCEEPLVVMAPAKWGQRDAHALLRDEPFIRFNRHLGGGKQADAYLRKAGITPHERFELSSLPAIAMLVDRGLGVSLAPDASVPWWRGLRVARLIVADQTYRRRFGIIWPRASVRTRLISALVAQARRAVSKAS